VDVSCALAEVYVVRAEGAIGKDRESKYAADLVTGIGKSRSKAILPPRSGRSASDRDPREREPEPDQLDGPSSPQNGEPPASGRNGGSSNAPSQSGPQPLCGGWWTAWRAR
jgi:hypothetical protein